MEIFLICECGYCKNVPKDYTFPCNNEDRCISCQVKPCNINTSNGTHLLSCFLPLPVAGIPVTEHLEVNVVPLAVTLTSKFYQTMQDFFFPKVEGESLEQQQQQSEPDHSHLFGPGGVQRMCVFVSHKFEEHTDLVMHSFGCQTAL